VTTRRTFSRTIFGMLAAIGASPVSMAQQPADEDDQDTLQPRGAPTGRVGAATRGIMREGAQNLALDLVAPTQAVGLTSVDQPTLCYLLTGTTSGPLRLTVTMRGQAKPLADVELPRPLSRFGVIDLHALNVRLTPGQLYVWSVALRLDPKAPARDLVASALVQYKPGGPAFDNSVRAASAEQQHAIFEQNGYWYDEVALAARNYAQDKGSALTALLGKAGLQAAK
jgi:Domain of Unknown Function (DUF928)